MRYISYTIVKFLLVACFSLVAASGHAMESWFTGPLLAPEAETVERGHFNLQFYSYSFFSNAVYDNHWSPITSTYYTSQQTMPEFAYGLSDTMDVVVDPLYVHNQVGNLTTSHIGDTSVSLGFQWLRQEDGTYQPDLRVALQEIFPTGRYSQLQLANDGADATGTGSYQTGLSFNFQYLSHLMPTHDLKTHVSFMYFYPGNVPLNGISAYGGTRLTKGVITPGQVFIIDLAGEFTLTQQWVAVLEGYYVHQQPTTFKGRLGDFSEVETQISYATAHLSRAKQRRRFFPSGLNVHGLQIDSPSIGNASLNEGSLTPAIEYNFSKNCGIVVGSWLTVFGKNTVDFTSLIAALNVTW